MVLAGAIMCSEIDYSDRSVMEGSTLAPRHAGTQHAEMETAANISDN
jgi:hypothetical protein